MKKKWWILIIVIVILLLGVIGLWIYFNNFACSIKNSNYCYKGCNIDSDCKMSYCTCINSNEKMVDSYPDGTMLKCDYSKCSCINNKCTGTGNSSMLI